MRLRYLASAIALAAFAPLAAEAGTPSYYLGLSGGANLPSDSEINSGTLDTDLDFDVGPTGSVYFGHRYSGTGFRTELEFGYRENDVDTIGGIDGTGDVSAFHGTVNLLYDFDGGLLKPYVGVGLGGAFVDVSNASPFGSGLVGDDDQTVVAFQGIAGLIYELSDSFELFSDYKFFLTEDVDVRLSDGSEVQGSYENHTLSVGFRWSFGGSKPKIERRPVKETPPPPPPPEPEPEPAPPPPPPPEPEPEPEPEPQAVLPQSFIVFFDWDQSVLTDEAAGIVRAAAAYSAEAAVTRIEVTGHADRSGPDSYNQRLSMRRADTVQAELVRLGVPGNAILVFARGEKEPLVPTDDGVREPQNRRVEIILE